jgi:CotH protein.
MKALKFFVLIAVITLTICASACASDVLSTNKLWFTLPDNTIDGLGEIRIYATDKAYYLFLPSSYNHTEGLVVRTTISDGIYVAGELVKDNELSHAIKPNEKVEIKIANQRYTLTIMQSSKIPAMWIATENKTTRYIHTSRSHTETGKMLLLDPLGETVYQGDLSQIKGRGNVTFAFPKKPYQIKLANSTDLLGMGKNKTWILLADFNDYSLMRNKLTFDFAAQLGLPYISQANWVDLYVDGNYVGTYLLCEKVQIAGTRIDIADLEEETEFANPDPLTNFRRKVLAATNESGTTRGYLIPENPPDITGGYLLELDYYERYIAELSGFMTKAGQPVVIKSPEIASLEQAAYIQSFMQGYENAISAPDGIDPLSGKHYSEIVDLDSLVAKYLVDEIAKNPDGNVSSQFFFKPGDSQSAVAFAGPVWDYDTSYGNFYTVVAAYALPVNLAVAVDTGEPYYWWPRLYRQPDFYKQVVSTYHHSCVPLLRILTGLDTDNPLNLPTLDAYEQLLTDSAAMNFTRWPFIEREKHKVDTGNSFTDNVAYLRNYIINRMAFLDETWVQ